MATKKMVTPINNRYNVNTLHPIRGRPLSVGDGLTAADILINIIIIPILNDVTNLRGFMIIWQMALNVNIARRERLMKLK
jgi:hypothetical protein